MKGKSYSIPAGMVLKKYYCASCGNRLVKSKTHRVVTKDDKDYYQYHDVGTYPRCDYDVYSYEFKCEKCNKNISYNEQCIIERIQKKYQKKILTDSEIKKEYITEKVLNSKRKYRSFIFIPVLMITIFFILFYLFDKDKNEKKFFVYIGLWALMILYTIFIENRSYKGENKLRKNRDYSEERKELLEKLHAYSSNNKDLIKESEFCYCFCCKKKIDSESIKEFLENENTALCPHCGIDSIIPGNINEDINDEIIDDMNNYWF